MSGGDDRSRAQTPDPSHLPKDHTYYMAKADYWNQSMFASSKVAKFYLKRRDQMQCRCHLALIQRREEDQAKATAEFEKQRIAVLSQDRVKSLERMERRKYDRARVRYMQLESASRQKPMPKVYCDDNVEGRLTPVTRLQLDKSKWEMVDDLPTPQLKKFISRKCLELDRRTASSEATTDIKARTREPLSQSASIQSRRQRIRSSLLKRHQYLAEVSRMQLESKAGVKKLRSDVEEYVETPFGVSKQYPASEGCSRLSKSREPGDFRTQGGDRDLKGLMHVDHLRAVSRLTGTHKESPTKVLPLRSKRDPSHSTFETEVNPTEIQNLLGEMDAFCEQCQYLPPSAGSQAAFAAIMKGVIDWKRTSTVTA